MRNITKILEEIKSKLPSDAMISEVCYEGCEIILYTKNKDFFKDSTKHIKKIVDSVKKRIEVRADPSLAKPEEKTEEIIKKTVPKEAGIRDIYFEPEFAKVIIHAEKPGLVIGKSGQTLKEIRDKTYWTPAIKRTGVIDSEVIKAIRRMLHKESDYRKKFMNELGMKIYSEGKEVEWIRFTSLGGFREVGRSCILLQTPQTRTLLDCGISGGYSTKPFPHLEAPEFHIQDLDAIVVSHAHMDHCLPPDTPVAMADGSVKNISDIRIGDRVLSLNFNRGKWEDGKVAGKTSTTGHRNIVHIKTPYREIDASPNHRFFTVRNLEICEIESQDLREDELIPSTLLNKTNNYSTSIKLNTEISYDPRRKDCVVLPETISAELATLIGYAQGDGHKSSGVSFRITDQDKEILMKYKEIIKKLFNFDGIIRHHSDRLKNAWWLEINNVKTLRFIETNFRETFIPSRKRMVPEKITNSNQKIKAAYLKGLFDAEGSVTSKHPSVKMFSASADMQKGVMRLLSEIGIPASMSRNTIKISSTYGIRRYSELIGFNSIKKTSKVLPITKDSLFSKEDIIPVTTNDLREIMKDARIIGRIHGSPRMKDDMSMNDWFHRSENSYCTRRIAKKLVNILGNRVEELSNLVNCVEQNPEFVRQRLSMAISEISDVTGLTRTQVEYREDGFRDEMWLLIENFLRNELNATILLTRSNIEKIQRIISQPVLWERIKSVEQINNPYEELIDVEVLPNRNFVANGVVVHNSGLVPYLFEYGYRGPVYCTAPTRDVMAMLHLDYIQLCQRENKKAPYTSKGIEEEIKHCITLEYGEVTDIAPDMRLTLENAGHILGSATLHLNIGNGLHNLLYTGDIKYNKTAMFDETSLNYARIESMIIESTYGSPDANMPDRKIAVSELLDAVRSTIEAGGKVVIPSFAVGRAQEVIVLLTETDIKCPIYLDGMVWDATAIHTAYPEFMSRRMQTKILHKGSNPFVDPRLKGIGSQQEREKVIESEEPCIIISTSGMLVGGPVIEYLHRLAGDSKNCLIFVGFQGEGTMGSRIQKGWTSMPVERNGRNETLDIKMRIVTIEGLSGHSSFNELMNFASDLKARPKKVIVNHGESSRTVELARAMHQALKVETIAPRVLETIRLR